MTDFKPTADQVLITYGPGWWGADDRRHVLSNIEDEADADAGFIAHEMWTLGAMLNHPGCSNDSEDADGYYSNECKRCQDYLIGVAARVLEALASEIKTIDSVTGKATRS